MRCGRAGKRKTDTQVQEQTIFKNSVSLPLVAPFYIFPGPRSRRLGTPGIRAGVLEFEGTQDRLQRARAGKSNSRDGLGRQREPGQDSGMEVGSGWTPGEGANAGGPRWKPFPR